MQRLIPNRFLITMQISKFIFHILINCVIPYFHRECIMSIFRAHRKLAPPKLFESDTFGQNSSVARRRRPILENCTVFDQKHSVRMVRWLTNFGQAFTGSVRLVRWLKNFYRAGKRLVGKVRWLMSLKATSSSKSVPAN